MKPAKKQIKILIYSAAAIMLAVLAGLSYINTAVAPDSRTENGTVIKEMSYEAVVTKVLDGDTVIVRGGDHVRLLGIDSDEKDYPCYGAARLRLEELVLSKTVRLEKDREDLDQYGRQLRYLFLNGENINQKLVVEGLAVARFYPENQKYKNEITAAEAKAIENKTGCKWGGIGQTIAGADSEAKQDFQWTRLTAGKIIEACETKNHLGEEVTVEGQIADAYLSETQTLFLNFGKPYPDNCFTAVVFKSNLEKFAPNPEKYYPGKTVRIKGLVKKYQEKPEIILDSPGQIEIGN